MNESNSFSEPKLEPIYLKIQQLEQEINKLRKSSQKVVVTGGLLSKQPQPLKISREELICLYNYLPQVLSEYATVVTLTNDTYRDKTDGQIFLEIANKGYYWVILTEDEDNKYYWLLPNGKIKISLHRLQNTMEYLYIIEGEKPYKNSEFTVEEPAIISILTDGETWKLETRGHIQVGKLSPAAKLLTELEKITKKGGKVPSSLQELLNLVREANNKSSLIQQQNSSLETNFIKQQNQLQRLDDKNIQEIKKLKTKLKDQQKRIRALWTTFFITGFIVVLFVLWVFANL